MKFTWHFDLETETNELVRLGMHGLWRLLHYSAKPRWADIFPMIRQSETLSWKLTDTTLTINFDGPEDVQRLWDGMFGTLTNGIIIPPGYETRPSDPRFYMSLLSSAAIGGTFFAGEMRSSKRVNANLKIYRTSRPIGEDDPEYVPAEKVGMPIRSILAKCRGEGAVLNSYPWASKYTDIPENTYMGYAPIGPYIRTNCPSLSLKVVTKKKTKNSPEVDTLAFVKGTTGGSVIHPCLSKWRDEAIKPDPRSLFAIYFAPYSYIYSSFVDGNTYGKIGIGLDLPAFSLSDEVHTNWSCEGEDLGRSKTIGSLVKVVANETVAVQAILAKLDAPEDITYPVLIERNKVFANSVYFAGRATNPLIAAFRRALNDEKLEPALSASGVGIYTLQGIPFRRQGEHFISLYTKVWRNLESGLPWYRDFYQLDALWKEDFNLVKNGKKHKNPELFFGSRKENALQVLVTHMEETNVLINPSLKQDINNIKAAIKDKAGKSGSWDRATDQLLNIYRTISTRRTLRQALEKIVNAVYGEKRSVFSEESIKYLESLPPQDARSALVITTAMYKSKTEGV